MPATVKPPIDMQTLEAIDVRVGTIVRVEDIAGARSLVRIRVDLGDHERTVLAGLKEERDDPTALEGMQALFVVNLKPREMMGEVSEGMLFDIGYADGITPVLAVPERPVPPGTRVA